MVRVTYSCDRASEFNLAEHLRYCDSEFKPRLSSRVNIDAYSKKLRRFATTFEAWSEQQLVGLVAVYINEKSVDAFVTSVSTFSTYQGRGIASHLMKEMIKFCRISEASMIELEVSRDSIQAITLYQKIGFQKISDELSGTNKMIYLIESSEGKT